MQANTNVTIPDTFDGLLSLTVCDAEIKGQDVKESFEPYLKISLGSSKLTQRLKEGETLGKERYTTQTKPQSGNHPVWNESHDFSIHKMKQDSHLKIKLFDRNVLKDEFRGLTRVDLSELVRNLSSQKQYYDLIDKNNNSIGRVGIITKFVGMDLPVQQVKKTGESIDQGQKEGAIGAGTAAKEFSKEPISRDVHDQGVGVDQDNIGGSRDQEVRGREEIKKLDRGREAETRRPSQELGRGAYDQHGDQDKFEDEHGVDQDKTQGRDFETTQPSKGHDQRGTGYDQRGTGYDQRGTGYDHGYDQRGTGYDQRGTGFNQDKIGREFETPTKKLLGRGTHDYGRHGVDQDREQIGRGDHPFDRTGDFGQSEKAYDRDDRDEFRSDKPSLTSQGIKEAFRPITEGSQQPGIISQAATLAGPTYRQVMPEALGGGYPVRPATIKDETGTVVNETSLPHPGILEKGKEKLGQAATLAGPTYRQTMPEALGGGYPIKPAVIKDEEGDVINEAQLQPTMLEKGREKVTQATAIAKETYIPKAQQMLEEGKVKLGEAAAIGKEKLSHAAILAGPTYRQTMPEALGGGYPVKPAIIKNERGDVISDTHEQPSVLEQGKEKFAQLVSGTPVASLIGATPVKEFVKPGPVVDVSVPHSEIPVLPLAQEQLLAVDNSNVFLEKPQTMATERLLYVETGPSTMSKVTGTVQSALSGATETAKGMYKEHMPEILGGRPQTFTEKLAGHTTNTSLVDKVKAFASETLPESLGGRAPTLTEKLTAAPSLMTKVKILQEETLPTSLGGKPALKAMAKEKYAEAKEKVVETTRPSLLTLAKEKAKHVLRPESTEYVHTETETETETESESLLERAKHTLKQNVPEAFGGGYPVQAGIIRDEEGNHIKVIPVRINEETGEIIEVEEIPSESLVERAKHTLKQTVPETLGGGYPVQAGIIEDENRNIISNRPAGVLEKAKEYLPGTTETGPSESMLDRAKHAIKQTMPEALGGGYPVQAAIIKDEHENIISKGSQGIIEKGKEKFQQTFGTEKPSEFQSDLEVWKSTQPSLLERAKQTYKETAPEVLGGRPALEGEKTFGEKAKEKFAEIKDRVQSSTSTTSTTTQPGLFGLMKETVTEVIPEMIGLKSIKDEPEIKHETTRVESTEDTLPVDTLPVDSDMQKLRVTEEFRKVDVDESGHVTQIETTQNVSQVPFVMKEILIKPEHTQKVEDIPLNEQPTLDLPLDNYEFQGQSVPAPTSQKVTMPSPQIMTSPEYTQQQQYQRSTFH